MRVALKYRDGAYEMYDPSTVRHHAGQVLHGDDGEYVSELYVKFTDKQVLNKMCYHLNWALDLIEEAVDKD
jgi:HD superfamily phosphohydrolase YqeK